MEKHPKNENDQLHDINNGPAFKCNICNSNFTKKRLQSPPPSQKMLSAPLSMAAEKNIRATMCIGQKILCLPYAGFYHKCNVFLCDVNIHFVPDPS